MIPKVEAFKLPLDRDQFRGALQKGMGRALMHVARFGASGVEDLIVEACVTNLAYDAQCEDDRAQWLFDIVDQAGLEECVYGQVIAAFKEFDQRKYWDRDQLCSLALIFAKRGHKDARDVLYASLRRTEYLQTVFAADQIVELDGADGLLHVAQKIGEWQLADPEFHGMPYLPVDYDKIHGEGRAMELLRPLVANNPAIAAFVNVYDEQQEYERNPGEDLRPTWLDWKAEAVIADVQSTTEFEGIGWRHFRRWGIYAPESEITKVVEALFAEPHPRRQLIYLGALQNRGVRHIPPLEFDERFIELAKTGDESIRWVTNGILSKASHPKVRDYVLDCIRNGRFTDREISLLAKNHHPGDWENIRASIRLPEDVDELHALLQSIMEVYEENPLPEACEPMILAYEDTPCSCCRPRAVEVLKSIDALPDWIREECRFDADSGTRNRAVSH